MRFSIFLLWLTLASATMAQAQNAYFFPNRKMNPQVPTPAQFLGHDIGETHTRYDRMVAYLQELDRLSERVSVQVIGQTYELRPQLIVMISSGKNISQLPAIQKDRQQLVNLGSAPPDAAQMPVLVQLGANVHGNEASGGEAMILAAYFYAACEDPEVLRQLDQMVLFIEPMLNPDGRERFVSWVNQNKGNPLVSDGNDREHNETWPGGRTNHYWFDLNRDWYLAVHRESQNRLRFYHQWLPNVVTDQHEMGTNATFFFEPSKENAENPLVPQFVYKNLNTKFAQYYEQALNEIGSLYYTKESFDNLYPGYGSSYPDMQGGIGILFEQASSRGVLQDSQHGPLGFAFTVRNQLLCALATCRAAVDERLELLKFQRTFFASSFSEAAKNPIQGFVVGHSGDAHRLRRFAQTLLLHQIECYQIGEDVRNEGQVFQKGKALFVPLAQPQYRLVRSMFDRPTKFADSLFYDASAWNMPLAFGLAHAEVKTAPSRGARIGADFLTPSQPDLKPSNYAYLIDYSDFMASQALYFLLKNQVLVKVATKPFTIANQSFGRGTLLVPAQGQGSNAAALHTLLQQTARQTGVTITPLNSGFSQAGVDLGSNYFVKVNKPEALLVVGNGVSAYEAGEVWYWLDTHVQMPITKVDNGAMARLNLSKYNVVVLVSGQYDKALAPKIKQWVANGGTLITLKTASDWAIRQEIVREKLRVLPRADSTAAARKIRLNYEDASAYEGARATGGAIFEADLDLTNPIGYGYSDRKLALYRNNNTLIEPSASAYNTVVQYSAKPWLVGYVHPQTLAKIAQSAAVVVAPEGAGRSVLFADNPNFRGIWYGTSKMFLNALFFGALLSPPNPFGAAD
jgi:Zinc carboxypeptidase